LIEKEAWINSCGAPLPFQEQDFADGIFSTPKNMSKKLTARLNVFIYFPLKKVYSKDIISSSSPQSTKTIKPCVIETSVPENSSMKKSIKLRLGLSITSLLHMYNVSAIHPFLPDEFWSTPLENRNALHVLLPYA
jgi:hypothetical protein